MKTSVENLKVLMVTARGVVEELSELEMTQRRVGLFLMKNDHIYTVH